MRKSISMSPHCVRFAQYIELVNQVIRKYSTIEVYCHACNLYPYYHGNYTPYPRYRIHISRITNSNVCCNLVNALTRQITFAKSKSILLAFNQDKRTNNDILRKMYLPNFEDIYYLFAVDAIFVHSSPAYPYNDLRTIN